MPFTSSFSVRATVATNILDAPARSKTRAHSETVVPVVNTSSTSRISRPAISSGRGHGKRAPKIFTALMPRESDLGLGFSPPLQHAGVQDQSTASSSDFHSMLSDQLGLVEAALTQLPRMQRHRDNRQRSRTGIHPADRFRQHPAEHDSGRSDLFVFQQVDQLAQAPVITAVGNRFSKGWSQPAAQATASLGRADSMRTENPLSADRADVARDAAKIGNAGAANRQAGNVDQGGTTETTIRWEESSEETFCNTAH